MYAIYDYPTICRAENVAEKKKFATFGELLSVLKKSAEDETPIEALQAAEFARFKIIR